MSVNIFRDGSSLVVPFDNPVFPARCVKTNETVAQTDHSIHLDCSSIKISKSSAGDAVAMVGRALGGGEGSRTARTALGAAEAMVTHKKLSAKIGLADHLRKRFTAIKLAAIACLVLGPLLPITVIAILTQLNPPGKPPNAILSGGAAALGGLLLIAGIVMFAVYSLGLLRATTRSATHAWLDGASEEFLAELDELPVEMRG